MVLGWARYYIDTVFFCNGNVKPTLLRSHSIACLVSCTKIWCEPASTQSPWHQRCPNGIRICAMASRVGWFQDGPMMAQYGPKTAHDGPKMAPRWPKVAQDGLKTAQRWPQDGPKKSQDGLGWPQDGLKKPQDAHYGFKKLQDGPR